MDIEGIRLVRVLDKDGSLMYVVLAFTATRAAGTAIYGFHSARKKADIKKALKEFEKAKAGNFQIVGKDSSNPLVIKQSVSAFVGDLVPDRADIDGKTDVITIGKLEKRGGKNQFTVKVEIDQGKDKKNPKGMLALLVPFEGDPGLMTDKVYHGSVGLMGTGPDVGKTKLGLYDTF